MSRLNFGFDDLPLITEYGFQAALINGSAEIEFDVSGEWWVPAISLDGHRWATKDERAQHGTYVRQSVPLNQQESPWLYNAIVGALSDGRFKDIIDGKVADQLGHDGVSIAPMDAEHRVSERV